MLAGCAAKNACTVRAAVAARAGDVQKLPGLSLSGPGGGRTLAVQDEIDVQLARCRVIAAWRVAADAVMPMSWHRHPARAPRRAGAAEHAVATVSHLL